jgi:hypothetical protein
MEDLNKIIKGNWICYPVDLLWNSPASKLGYVYTKFIETEYHGALIVEVREK